MTQVSVQSLSGGARGGQWRRPPAARRWPLRTRLGYGLTIGLLFGLSPDANMLARHLFPFPLPFAIAYVCIVGLELGYGTAVIATAGSGRVGRRLWAGLPCGANPVSRVWWGLAFVLGAPVSYATGLIWPVSVATPSAAATLLFCAGTLAAAGCLLVSVGCSNIEVKQRIRSGRAPTYRLSRDHFWWWDGDGWASVAIAVPVGALRSPDGTHWWSGEGWVPIPPRPGRR